MGGGGIKLQGKYTISFDTSIPMAGGRGIKLQGKYTSLVFAIKSSADEGGGRGIKLQGKYTPTVSVFQNTGGEGGIELQDNQNYRPQMCQIGCGGRYIELQGIRNE